MSRPENRLSMGYVPTPASIVEQVMAYFSDVKSSAGRPYRFADFGWGDGRTLEAAKAKGFEIYGCEPDPDRYNAVSGKIEGLNGIFGGLEDVDMAQWGFSLLWFNPPYSNVSGERVERTMLSRLIDSPARNGRNAVTWGGAIVIIVQGERLGWSELGRLIAQNFSIDAIFPVNHDQLDENGVDYNQVVIIGRRMNFHMSSNVPGENAGLLERIYLEYSTPANATYRSPRMNEPLKWIVPEEPIRVQASITTGAEFYFTTQNITRVMVQEWPDRFSSQKWTNRYSVERAGSENPLLPPSTSQVAGVMLAGMLSNIELDGRIMTARMGRVTTQRDNDDASYRVTEDFATSIRYIDINEPGLPVVDLSTPEDVADFIETDREPLAKAVNDLYPPMYTADMATDDEMKELDKVLKTRKMPHRKEMGMLALQKHISIAAARLLTGELKVKSDMAGLAAATGTGKTHMSVATGRLVAMKTREQRTAPYVMFLATVPHAVGKLAADIAQANPDIEVINVYQQHEMHRNSKTKRMNKIPLKSFTVFSDAIRRIHSEDTKEDAIVWASRGVEEKRDRIYVIVGSHTNLRDSEGWAYSGRMKVIGNSRMNTTAPKGKVIKTVHTTYKADYVAYRSTRFAWQGNERVKLHEWRHHVAVPKTYQYYENGVIKVTNTETGEQLMLLRPRYNVVCPNCGESLRRTMRKGTENLMDTYNGEGVAHTKLYDELDNTAKTLAKRGAIIEYCTACRVPVTQDCRLKERKPYFPKKRNPRNPTFAISDYMAVLKTKGKPIDLFIFDEAHLANQSTAQLTLATLSATYSARHAIYATATIFNGKASALYLPMTRFSPRLRKRFGIDMTSSGDHSPKAKWIKAFGRTETLYKPKSEGNGYYAARNRVRTNADTEVTEKAGVSPELLLPIISQFAFANFNDIGAPMPQYIQMVEPLSPKMGRGNWKQLWREVQEWTNKIDDEVAKNPRCVGSANTIRLGLTSAPWQGYTLEQPLKVEGEQVYQEVVENGKTKRRRVMETLLEIPPLMDITDTSIVSPKERYLFELVMPIAKQTNTKVGIFIRHIHRGIQDRLLIMAKHYGYDLKFMPDVEASKRVAWIDDNVEKHDGIIMQVERVKSSIDLIGFNHLFYYETWVSLETMIQSMGRHWRIGQKRPCYTWIPAMLSGKLLEGKWLVEVIKKIKAHNFLHGLDDEPITDFTDEDTGVNEDLIAIGKAAAEVAVSEARKTIIREAIGEWDETEFPEIALFEEAVAKYRAEFDAGIEEQEQAEQAVLHAGLSEVIMDAIEEAITDALEERLPEDSEVEWVSDHNIEIKIPSGRNGNNGYHPEEPLQVEEEEEVIGGNVVVEPEEEEEVLFWYVTPYLHRQNWTN